MRRTLLIALAALPILATPASADPPKEAAARFVTVEQLAAAPDRWDGKRVRVEGLAVREFEDYGLFASYEDFCRGEPMRNRSAIYVDWPQSPGDIRHFRRNAVIEGVFHNRYPQAKEEDGEQVIVVNNAAPGPGPLSDVHVVRWTSGELGRCGQPDPEEAGGRHLAY